MFRNAVVAFSCLASVQTTDQVVRLGEARYLTDTDWIGIREGLGAERIPWVISVSPGFQVGPFRWHANAYLPASVVSDGLRRGQIVDLEATYEGGPRVWRELGLGGTWAQVALPAVGLQDDFAESDLGRPFVVRGEFSDAEIRAIIAVIRRGEPIPSSRDATAQEYGGATTGIVRTGLGTVTAYLMNGTFPMQALLELKGDRWVVTAIRIVVA
jgi:hypothetical protein